MAEHSAEGAVREFFAANVSFHELLCELSGNPKLQEVHHRLEGEIGRFQNRTLALRGSMDDSLTEHRAILAAIRLRDADRAAALTAGHIRVPAQRLQAALREDGPEQASGPEPTASGAGVQRPSAWPRVTASTGRSRRIKAGAGIGPVRARRLSWAPIRRPDRAGVAVAARLWIHVDVALCWIDPLEQSRSSNPGAGLRVKRAGV